MKAYRIIRNEHENGKTTWGLQKLKKSWLTGKEYWVNYWSDSWEYGWYRSADRATMFCSEEAAMKVLKDFLGSLGWGITKSTVVKEFKYEE